MVRLTFTPGLLLCLSFPLAAFPLEPSNPNATEDVRKILKWLESLPKRTDNRVVSGHYFNMRVQEGIDKYVRPIHEQTGKWLALAAHDFIWWNSTNAPENIQALTNWWNDGGLVMLSWHQTNPETLQGYRGHCDLKQVVTPGTTVNKRYLSMLDERAEWLTQLKNNGVVVFWRPYHECNCCFWWGKTNKYFNKTDYVALWRYMHDYFVRVKNLDNLIWVYAPDWFAGCDEYYPGDKWVDIVAIDYYGTSDLSEIPLAYKKMTVFGKPFGISELGHYGDCTSLMDNLKRNFPNTVFVVPWYGKYSFLAHGDVKALVDDPWIITRDEVDWKK